jgi:hypothetical protein
MAGEESAVLGSAAPMAPIDTHLQQVFAEAVRIRARRAEAERDQRLADLRRARAFCAVKEQVRERLSGAPRPVSTPEPEWVFEARVAEAIGRLKRRVHHLGFSAPEREVQHTVRGRLSVRERQMLDDPGADESKCAVLLDHHVALVLHRTQGLATCPICSRLFPGDDRRRVYCHPSCGARKRNRGRSKANGGRSSEERALRNNEERLKRHMRSCADCRKGFCLQREAMLQVEDAMAHRSPGLSPEDAEEILASRGRIGRRRAL